MQDDKPDKKAGTTAEADRKKPGHAMPAAGPHARPELTNPDATPGTGSLPDIEDDDMGGVSS